MKKSLPAALLVALLLLICTPQSLLAALTAPEARGRLCLAWDEMESGRCKGALSYVGDIGAIEGDEGDDLAEEVLWLKAECLRLTGKYAAAAQILESEGVSEFDWRDELWEYLILDWSREATSSGNYREAAAILQRGVKNTHDPKIFEVLLRATSNRAEFAQFAESGREGRLKAGGDLRLLPLGKTPGEPEWSRVCPPEDETWWAEWQDCTKWMAAGAKKLSQNAKAAWLRYPQSDFSAALVFECEQLGIAVSMDKNRALLSRGGFPFQVDLEVSRKRAALEGLGLRGGALMVVTEADRNLDAQRELVVWLRNNAHDLGVQVDKDSFVLKHLRTGRASRFHTGDWVDMFGEEPEEWEKLISEVQEELGREKRPFKCFCGRDMVLRETLTNHWEGLISTWKEDSVGAVLIAACPKHWILVTQETLDGWGVGVKEALERSVRQSTDAAWEVNFKRGASGTGEFAVFAGTGISGIARRPGLLLGVLEALEGKDLGGQTVKVWAPLPDALVVGPATLEKEAASEGAKMAAHMLGAVDSSGSAMGYNATVKLPKRPEGSFKLVAGDK